jgi:hypothetical protein
LLSSCHAFFAHTQVGREVQNGTSAGNEALADAAITANHASNMAQHSKLRNMYNDLFANYLVLCEEHGKLKAEADGLRAAVQPCVRKPQVLAWRTWRQQGHLRVVLRMEQARLPTNHNGRTYRLLFIMLHAKLLNFENVLSGRSQGLACQ